MYDFKIMKKERKRNGLIRIDFTMKQRASCIIYCIIRTMNYPPFSPSKMDLNMLVGMTNKKGQNISTMAHRPPPHPLV